MNVAVYCSSRPHLDPHHIEMARILGKWLGDNKHTMVYGGVDAGLMHVAAKAAHEHGGQLLGVVTRDFAPRTDKLVDRLITTDDLNTRKAQMYHNSDIHVVLPGGVGTIDEWISALSQMVVDNHHGVGLVIVNADGMYDNLLAQLQQLAGSKFAGDKHLQLMRVVSNADEMIATLNELSINYINNNDNEK